MRREGLCQKVIYQQSTLEETFPFLHVPHAVAEMGRLLDRYREVETAKGSYSMTPVTTYFKQVHSYCSLQGFGTYSYDGHSN